MRGKGKARLAALLLTLASAATAAADSGYDYLEFGYRNIEQDDMVNVLLLDPSGGPGTRYGVEGSGSGIAFTAAWSISDHWFLKASQHQAELESDALVGSTSVDHEVRRLRITFGGHWPLASSTDLVAEAGVVRMEVIDSLTSSFSIKTDDNSYHMLVGVRHQFNESIEGFVHAGQEALFDDTQTLVHVGGRYAFTDRWSLVLDYASEGDFTSYGLSGRFAFR